MADEAPRTFRDEWERYLYGTARVSDSPRVLLLALVREMDDDGQVAVHLPSLADLLQRGKPRISERCKTAVEAGLLVQVRRGTRGSPALYQAVIPGRSTVAREDRSQDADSFPPGGTLSSENVPDHRTLSEESVPDHRKLSSESIPDHRTLSQESVLETGTKPDSSFPSGGTKQADSFPPGGTNPPTYKEREVEEDLKNTPSADQPALFGDTPESDIAKPTEKRLTRSEAQRVNALVKVFYEAADGMVVWEKVYAVVKAALNRGRTDEQIEQGLLRLANEGRFSISLPSLGIAIHQNEADTQAATGGRANLRSLPGGMSAQERNQRGTDALFDAAMERALAREEQLGLGGGAS